MSEDKDSPEFILGIALAAWANPPRWHTLRLDSEGLESDCTREEAEQRFTEFLSEVCANWGLVVVSLSVLKEMERE